MSLLPVLLTAEAEADMDEAAEWYEARSVGLGVDFVKRAREAMDLIASNPRLYRELFAGLRRAPMMRFPYGIFHRAQPDRIEVVAVFHDRRDPSVWQGRA